MIPSGNRLKTQADFQLVRTKGRKAASGSLGVYFLPQNRPTWRLGITISGRVVKSAVKRNRIRRLLSAALAEAAEGWGERVKGDIVILLWRDEPSEAELKAQLIECLEKLSLA